jgi:hypothetical protein
MRRSLNLNAVAMPFVGKRQPKLDRYLDDAPRSGNQAKVTAFKWWTLGRGWAAPGEMSALGH